jgi:hypothetical protein
VETTASAVYLLLVLNVNCVARAEASFYLSLEDEWKSACAICGLFSAVLAKYIKRKKSPKLKNVIDHRTLEASKHSGKNLLRAFCF